MVKQTFKRLITMIKQLFLTREKKTMASAKTMWILLEMILGIPSVILGIVNNLDNIKSTMIAILAIIYLMIRIYYYAVQKRQNVREKEIELKSKEIDLWFRQQEKLKATSQRRTGR